jgi:hypothetical protein
LQVIETERVAIEGLLGHFCEIFCQQRLHFDPTTAPGSKRSKTIPLAQM